MYIKCCALGYNETRLRNSIANVWTKIERKHHQAPKYPDRVGVEYTPI